MYTSFHILIVGLAVSFVRTFEDYQHNWVQIGKEAILSCPTQEIGILRLCLWNRFDKNWQTTFNISLVPTRDNETLVLNENYSYVGNILHECGLRIKNASEADVSFWQCTTALKENETVQMTNFHLHAGVQPTKPEILEKSRLQSMVAGENNTLSLTCCSENGIPKPLLEYYIGGKRVLGVEVDDSQIPSRYCINLENATFKPSDNGQNLFCTQHHPLLPKESDSEIIKLYYGPILVDSRNVYKAVDSLVLRANPRPNVNAIIKETNESLTVEMHFLFIKGNKSLPNDIWDITWNITKDVPENQTILIVATNPYGELSIRVATPLQKKKSVSYVPDTIHSIYRNKLCNTILSWISNIGWSTLLLVIGSVIAVTLCMLVIAISKCTSSLCFRSNSGGYEFRYASNSNGRS